MRALLVLVVVVTAGCSTVERGELERLRRHALGLNDRILVSIDRVASLEEQAMMAELRGDEAEASKLRAAAAAQRDQLAILFDERDHNETKTQRQEERADEEKRIPAEILGMIITAIGGTVRLGIGAVSKIS